MFFPHYHINGKFLRKEKVVEHKMYVFILSASLPGASLILRKIQRAVTTNVEETI